MELWRAFCSEDWEEGEEPDTDTAERLKAPHARRARAEGGCARDAGGGLPHAAEELAAHPPLKERATATLERLRGELRRFQLFRAEAKYLDIPLPRFARQYGQDQHRRLAGSLSCDVTDQFYPGTRKRPDCVKVDSNGCYIYEFKPRSAEEAAKRQAAEYVESVQRYYRERLRTDCCVPPTKPTSGRASTPTR